VLAYNLVNFLRTLACWRGGEHWPLTMREKLVKIGARIARHGRYVVFQLAEVAVPRALFGKILRGIKPCGLGRPRWGMRIESDERRQLWTGDVRLWSTEERSKAPKRRSRAEMGTGLNVNCFTPGDAKLRYPHSSRTEPDGNLG
jgi:hypothetical protein